jgi:hypothetical protein
MFGPRAGSTERINVAASNDDRFGPDHGPRDRSLRVGDKERDAVAKILRQAHVEGRLDADEFPARLDRCLAARTYADLDELVADFPHRDGGTPRVRRARYARGRPLPFPPLPVAMIAAIVLGFGHVAWLALPLFLFFVVRPFAWRSWGTGHARGPRGCGGL